jgi:leader peptidase (prepilin peptidase) / N-methyltransferase
VCIYRLQEGRSIVFPGSSCRACNAPIRFYDNIPMVSYVLLRGKCRQCGAGISARYPLVECLTGLLFLFLYRKFGITLELPANMLFAALLVVISFIDLDTQIIPDVLSLGGLVAGFLLSLVRPFFGILDSLYGILLGGGILFTIAYGYQLITKREGMGGGDIKLIGMIGAFCGIKGVIFSIMSASLVGTLVGVPLMLIKGRDTKYAIPFGPFLSLGGLLFVFAGDSIIYGFFRFMAGRGE